MKKRIHLLLAFIILLLVANQSYALFRETYFDYYDDDAFLDWNGYYYIYCDGSVDTNGVTESWRIWNAYRCSDGARVVHRCQQTNGMGGWIDVGCPPWDP
jgi:hypothetical protein